MLANGGGWFLSRRDSDSEADAGEIAETGHTRELISPELSTRLGLGYYRMENGSINDYAADDRRSPFRGIDISLIAGQRKIAKLQKISPGVRPETLASGCRSITLDSLAKPVRVVVYIRRRLPFTDRDADDVE
nr:hypothetical protein Iba_chr01fCG8390 [Ipomoea batatas]